MPLVFLEQLPLPSLKSYVAVSVLVFVSAILYALNVTIGSEESNVPVYDFMSQDNFCFWVSRYYDGSTQEYLVNENDRWFDYMLAYSFSFSVELEYGLLLFIFVWENHSESRVRRSSSQWTTGESKSWTVCSSL